MQFLYFLIIGIVAGALAKMVVPGEGPGGILGDLVLGVVGAMIAGFLGFGAAGLVGSIFTAFLGAALLLFIVRLLTKNRAAH